MKSIVVEDIRYAGKYGGAVFSGRCSEGTLHRYVADYKVMPRVPTRGEVWRVRGHRHNHPKFGLQYVTTEAALDRPSGRLIINAIANSSLFPGIGEKLADKLFRRYGERLYDMLDEGNSEPFVKPLKSRELARTLVSGWHEVATEAATYKWLNRRAAPVWLARKIVDLYGDEAVGKLEENPYRLQAFTNWKVADDVARSLGIIHDDERRLVAAIDAVVANRLEKKHTWAKTHEFKKAVMDFLKCDLATAEKAIRLAIEDNAIVEVCGGIQGIGPASMEQYIASVVSTMANGDYRAGQQGIRIDPDVKFMESFFEDYHAKIHITLNAEQRNAVTMAVREPAGIICGGAGVGKTTVLKAICAASDRLGGQIHMMALSGRVARRMSDATGREAMTIAAFLSKVDKGEIVLIDSEATIAIDEASMIDLPTMYRLLRRLEPGCRLLLIGDPGQLPPISFGLVFHTLFERKAVPTVELTQIQRQAATTGIPQASSAIRDGNVPSLKAFAGVGVGVEFLDADREGIPGLLIDILADLGGFEDARILTPVKNGPAGTRNTNAMFHQELACGKVDELHGFGEGEPVIWTENDYDLDLMNGSLGKILKVTDEGLVIDWDNCLKATVDLKNMDHAYAITVDKSQGSQFKRCVIPVFKNRLLDRTMLYTAITRAEEQVVLIGDRKAFEEAITDPPSKSLRETGLCFYL